MAYQKFQGQWLPRAAAMVLAGVAAVSMLTSTSHAQTKLTPEQRTLLKTFAEEFVEVTPGTGRFPASFVMGSNRGAPNERPPHRVTFQRAFSIARYEVPQNLYEIVMGQNPSRWKGARNSVEMISWADAQLFCLRCTSLLREHKLIGPKDVVRLPTEAEWEYCCRAGTTTAYSFGDRAIAPGDAENKASVLDKYGWHTGNAAGNDPAVGSLAPNAWGLYDMHGYLSEYVADAWHDRYEGAPADGSGWDVNHEKGNRVMRGGSWRDPHPRLRSAARQAVPPHARTDAIGFRCVKSVE